MPARKYRCLHEKSCTGYKNRVFVENVWAGVDKEMGFEEGKEFSYFLGSMKFNRRTRFSFTRVSNQENQAFESVYNCYAYGGSRG